MVKPREEVITQFHTQVNMTATELEEWINSDESHKAGTGVGIESGHKIIAILHKNPEQDPEKYTEEDIEHMRKVVAYNARHMAQEDHLKDTKTPEQLEHTKSTISLRNWGHDPLKTLDEQPSSEKPTTPKAKKTKTKSTPPKSTRTTKSSTKHTSSVPKEDTIDEDEDDNSKRDEDEKKDSKKKSSPKKATVKKSSPSQNGEADKDLEETETGAGGVKRTHEEVTKDGEQEEKNVVDDVDGEQEDNQVDYEPANKKMRTEAA